MDWFFSDDDLDDLSRLSVNLSLPADTSEIETTTSNNHSLLLNNIQKVEGTISNLSRAFDVCVCVYVCSSFIYMKYKRVYIYIYDCTL